MSFGKKQVLDDVSIEVHSGEILVLIGPSGCGKSTLLNIIAGLVHQTSGEILFDDSEMSNISVQNRNVAMVFQNYGLYPHMTVEENISFPLTNRKLPQTEIKQRVSEIASTLHIEDLLEHKPNQISGGQKQRVAIARAIIRNPTIFLMDEPLSSLDSNLRTELRTEIKRICKTLNVPIVYVTHDRDEALSLATRIGVIQKGRIVQIGNPHDVYAKPNSAFTATFLDPQNMNILNNITIKELASTGLIEDIDLDDNPCDIGIRSHDFTISRTTGASLEIVDYEYHGRDTQTIADLKISSRQYRVKVDGFLKDGDHVSIDAKNILVFNQ